MDQGRFGAVAASLVAMAIGCRGGSLDATGGLDASTDVGVSGEAGGDASEAGALDVCGAFFDAFFACEGPPSTGVPGDLNTIPDPLLPASEVARIRGRYETVCAAVMALPGTGFTASAVAACTAAIESEGCISGEADPACSFSGISAAGALCADPALNDQCGDGCVLHTQTDAGTFTLRQPCALAPFDTNGCGASAGCNVAAPEVDGGPSPDYGTCIALTIVGAGQGCAVFGDVCDTGTYCYSPSSTGTDATCAPAGKAGDGCPLQRGPASRLPVRGSCAAPLFCSVPGDAGAGTCQAPGDPGASCEQDSECATGLGCVGFPTAPPVPGTCETVTFVAAGQTCDGSGSVRCLQGYCSAYKTGAPTGTCPAVIADGQPCQTNVGPPCDAYGTCVKGTCTLGYPRCP